MNVTSNDPAVKRNGHQVAANQSLDDPLVPCAAGSAVGAVRKAERIDKAPERPKAGSNQLVEKDISSIKPDPTPDWSQMRPLIEQLVKIATGHGGTFLVATVGSEDPETGSAIGSCHFHLQNDEHASNQVLLQSRPSRLAAPKRSAASIAMSAFS